MLRCNRILVWLAVAAAMCGSAAAANLMLNPGFETGDFTDWTVTGDGVAIDTAFPNTGCCDAVFSATTTDPDAGVLSQTLSTEAGKSYMLSFTVLDEAGFTGGTFTVQFGGFSETITGDEAAPPGNLPSLYTAETFIVPALDIIGGATVLSFKGLNDPSLGIDWNLDDVSVTGSAVPEPATWVLLALAFGGLAIQRRLKVSRRQAGRSRGSIRGYGRKTSL
jgi:PEP-CTERM motif